NRTVLNNSNVLTYSNARSNTDFSSRHSIDVLLGHEIVQRQSKAYFVENRLFPIGITPERALGNMSLGTTPAGLSTSTELTDRIVSAFTRLNYVLDKKYLVTLTMRADGSSKFSQKNKWGYFPSASVAWRLSEENFMSQINNTVSDLKLRLSYGQAGNNRIDDFLYLTQFNANVFYDLNNQLITGYGPAGLANENLKWETTTARNIGLDAGFLKNRIQLSVDLYKNTTSDNLLDVLVPTTSGYTVQKQNVGATANKGVELQINATPIQNKDFTWNANFNISFNKNEIESLGPNQSGLVSSGWAGGNTPEDFTVAVGQSVGTMWGFVTDGFYTLDDFNYSNGVYSLKSGVPSNRDITAVTPQPGMLKFKDLDGNNNITIAGDRTIIGSSQPKFFGGLNQQFTYKNFDMSVFVNFQYGNDILNANKLEFSSGYTDNSNLLAIMNDRWRNVNAAGQVVTDPAELAKLNTNATIWSPLTSASSFYSHSWAVEDGSFLRINNITVGYTLPTRIVNKIKISKLRIYGTINNLAVFTNYSGYDPEVNTRRNSPLTSGVDYSAYPRSRAFIVGANLSL
ncbi:MAG TPA: SusC/RagA family TonB-linked outer membrane protein, partial [Chitinophagaceae bacterium]